MDQVKTGKFISELRREKEMTQNELAEKIGVSSKAVSKWECGRGMPDISTLPVLCETLGISVNELLSGERLPAESYTERAEENMVTLLKDSRSYNKNGSLLAVASPIAAAAGVLIAVLYLWGGDNVYSWFISLPTLLILFFITTVFLLSAGCYSDLWKAFGYAAGVGAPTVGQLSDALNAVKLAGKTLLISGAVITVTELMLVLFNDNIINDSTSGSAPMLLAIGIGLAFIHFLYGLAGYLLSLPIIARINRRKNRLSE